MPIFSGRIDQIYDELNYNADNEEVTEITMMEVFDNFTEQFDCCRFIFAFEDKDKTGLFARKPHYHFIITTDAKQDTMRRWLSKQGFKGALASMKPIGDEVAGYNYTLKQQQVVFTDIDEVTLNAYLELSLTYNKEIAPTKNIQMDVLEEIIQMYRFDNKVTRQHIAEQIYKKYSLINQDKTWDQIYCYPNGQQLLKMIQYVESKTSFSSYEMWAIDNRMFINPSQYQQEKTIEAKHNSYARIYED